MISFYTNESLKNNLRPSPSHLEGLEAECGTPIFITLQQCCLTTHAIVEILRK